MIPFLISLSLFMSFLKELGIFPKDDIVHLYLSMSEECEFINLTNSYRQKRYEHKSCQNNTEYFSEFPAVHGSDLQIIPYCVETSENTYQNAASYKSDQYGRRHAAERNDRNKTVCKRLHKSPSKARIKTELGKIQRSFSRFRDRDPCCNRPCKLTFRM